LITKFAGNAKTSVTEASKFYDLLEAPLTSLADVVKSFELLAKGA
jgi:hypothetical protein